jgi:hypothetical protein
MRLLRCEEEGFVQVLLGEPQRCRGHGKIDVLGEARDHPEDLEERSPAF